MQALRRRRGGLAPVILAVTLVGIAAPTQSESEVRFAATADIQANQQATIFSNFSGDIRRIYMDRGDLVKEGQPPTEIDDQELRAQLETYRTLLTLAQTDHANTRIRVVQDIPNVKVSTVVTSILIPPLHVMVETRFPRRVESPEISLTPQGESA